MDALHAKLKAREQQSVSTIDAAVMQRLDDLKIKPVKLNNAPVYAYEQRGDGGVERRIVAAGKDAGKVILFAEASIPDHDISIPLDQVGETVVVPRAARVEKDSNGDVILIEVTREEVEELVQSGDQIYGLEVDETMGDYKPAQVGLPKQGSVRELYQAANIVETKVVNDTSSETKEKSPFQYLYTESGPFMALLPEQNDASTWFEKTVDLDTEKVDTGDLILAQHKVTGASNESLLRSHSSQLAAHIWC